MTVIPVRADHSSALAQRREYTADTVLWHHVLYIALVSVIVRPLALAKASVH